MSKVCAKVQTNVLCPSELELQPIKSCLKKILTREHDSIKIFPEKKIALKFGLAHTLCIYLLGKK